MPPVEIEVRTGSDLPWGQRTRVTGVAVECITCAKELANQSTNPSHGLRLSAAEVGKPLDAPTTIGNAINEAVGHDNQVHNGQGLVRVELGTETVDQKTVRIRGKIR